MSKLAATIALLAGLNIGSTAFAQALPETPEQQTNIECGRLEIDLHTYAQAVGQTPHEEKKSAIIPLAGEYYTVDSKSTWNSTRVQKLVRARCVSNSDSIIISVDTTESGHEPNPDGDRAMALWNLKWTGKFRTNGKQVGISISSTLPYVKCSLVGPNISVNLNDNSNYSVIVPPTNPGGPLLLTCTSPELHRIRPPNDTPTGQENINLMVYVLD